MILVLVAVLLVFGIGGSRYAYRHGWGNGSVGPLGLVLLVLLLLWALGA